MALELRKDPMVDRWVLFSPDRAKRPHDFAAAPPRRTPQRCPFCAGHEDATPAELLSLCEPQSAGDRRWSVRVVPNKFPALETADVDNHQQEDLYQRMRAVGADEVIIESPDHDTSIRQLSSARWCEVLWAYRQRLEHWRRDGRLAYGLVFKNSGAQGGASLEHVHSHLMVLPMVPQMVSEEWSGALAYLQREGRCALCAIVAEELAIGRRVVAETANYVAFCPFASRFPLETWIAPKSHVSQYEAIDREQTTELAPLMQQVIGRIESLMESPAYNYYIHTSPFDTHAAEYYHWHMEIFARQTRLAGFELGSGYYINPLLPEEAAARLRSSEV